MDNPKRGACGAKMKGNGTTKAGTKRWRCPKCGASSVRKNGNAAKQPSAFLRRPTDDDADVLFAAASSESKREDGAPDEYGTGIVWEAFHMPTNYRR